MEDKVLLLEKKLAREKKARSILEEEIEAKTSKLFIAYEYNKSIYNALGFAVVVTDLSGNIIGINKKSQEYFPFLIEDKNISFFDVIFSEGIPDGDLIKRFTVEEFSFEFRFFDKIFLAHVSFLHDTKAELIFSIRDITIQKNKEKEFIELHNQIIESAYRDGVAENATSILHNIGNVLTTIINLPSKEEGMDQLSISINILEKMKIKIQALKTKDEAIAFVQDEKGGIQFIKIFNELCKNFRSVESTLKQYVKFTEEKCFHIADIISTQQKFANFRETKLEKINLLSFFNDCQKLLSEKIKKSKVEIQFDIDPSIIISTEKVGFAQVVTNLIINSVESMDEREQKDATYNQKTLSVSAINVGKAVKIILSDNGSGIDKEILNNLFKFGYSTKSRGSGFGLHNCANFMKKNNGDIELMSEGKNLGAQIVLICPI